MSLRIGQLNHPRLVRKQLGLWVNTNTSTATAELPLALYLYLSLSPMSCGL